MKGRGKLLYDIDVFLLEDNCIYPFKLKEDKDVAMNGRSWLITDQLLVMVRWIPNFQPGVKLINSTVVWLRLFNLPMEYWNKDCILSIVSTADQPVALDRFMDQL